MEVRLLFRPPLVDNAIQSKKERMDNIAIMNKARENYRLEYEIQLKRQAALSFEQYKNDLLFVAGIMLYWAEGKTTKNEVYNLELNNSNPNLLKLYCNFLRKYLNIKDSLFRVRLFLYPDLDERKVKLFWSKLLNFPLSQFIKSYICKIRSTITKNKLQYGTCSVYIGSRVLRLTMEVWIQKFVSLYC